MSVAVTTSSSTLENQLFEVIEYISRKQADETANPDGVSIVTAYSRNNTTGLVTVTLNIPTEDVIHTNGGNLVTAAEVFEVAP
ncbi:MAG: hypothetical protein ACP5D6_09845 [Kosmotogaceae bacterium]